MRKLLFLFLIAASVTAKAQSYLRPNSSYGMSLFRLSPDSVLHIPKLSDLLAHTSYTTLPQIRNVGDSLWFFNGTAWKNISRIATAGSAAWGAITGTLSDQTDLQTALDLKVPTARAITINGVTLDLSANRSWTVGGVTDIAATGVGPVYSMLATTGTTTKVLNFNLLNQSAYTIFGNNAGSSAAPSFFNPALASALFQNQGSTTTLLHGNAAGNPTWAAVNLTTDVTGVLPGANGGTSVLTTLGDWLNHDGANPVRIAGNTTTTTKVLTQTGNGTISALPVFQPVIIANWMASPPAAGRTVITDGTGGVTDSSTVIDNVFDTIKANTGQTSPTVRRDVLNVLGTGVISTTISGKTITIGGSGFATSLGYVNVVDYGADSTGSRGSGLAFKNAVATCKTVYVPPGRYKIEGIDSAITLCAGQTIFGLGSQSELFTTTNGSTSTLATAMNFIICANGHNTVRDLKFTGNGKTTYAFPWTSQNGVWVYSGYNEITGCSFKNLKGTSILAVHPSLSTFAHNNIHDNFANNCTQGFFSYAGAEYLNFSINHVDSCDIGINERGANNNIFGNVFEYNNTNGLFQGNGANTDHSYVTGNIFNHGVNKNLDIKSIVISLTFCNNGMWSAPNTIDESVGVSFNGDQFGSGSNVTVSATSTTKPTFFRNIFRTTSAPAPVFTETGTGQIVLFGDYNQSTTTKIQSNYPAGYKTNVGSLLTIRDWVDKGYADSSITANAGWSLSGNTVGANGKILGTNDNFNLLIQTNGKPRITIPGTGNMLFGDATFGNSFSQMEFDYNGNVSYGAKGLRLHDVFSGGDGVIQMISGSNFYFTNPSGTPGSITAASLNNGNTGNTIDFTASGVNINGDRFGIGVAAPLASLSIKAGTTTANTAPIQLATGTSETTPRAGLIQYTTPKLTFTNGGLIEQELIQSQQSRVSTQFDKTSSTTLSDITGLTATLVAGKTYRFEAKLYTTSNVAGGVKFAIAGTATATNVIYEGLTTDAGLTTQSRGTAMATAVGAVTAVTAAYVTITGTITVNAAGTITVQFAQNASNGSASSVLVGSTFVVSEML